MLQTLGFIFLIFVVLPPVAVFGAALVSALFNRD